MATQDAPAAVAVPAASSEPSSQHQQYIDSLIPPSQEDFEKIARVQEEHEMESRRRSRELWRRSAELQQQQQQQQQQHQQQHHHHQQQHHHHHRGKSSDHGSSSRSSLHLDERRAKAAKVIQRTYRGYRTRREMQGFGLDASTRWMSAIREAQYRELMRPRPRSVLSSGAADGGGGGDGVSVLSGGGGDGDESAQSRPSTAKGNWKKAAMVARRAGRDEPDSEHSSSSSLSSEPSSDEGDSETLAELRRQRQEANERRRRQARMMGLQYFLEMVDLKHRYGSNLRIYHEQWKAEDTKENFFYWLDYGGGKNLEMAACPRDRLEREQVRYLSREERQYYLVEVDHEGRLCWAKNGARIDTTEKFRDSIQGIVPADDATERWVPSSHSGLPHVHEEPSDTVGAGSRASTDSSAESALEADRAAKYATPDFDDAKGVRKVQHLSVSTIINHLLRKSVKKNTWIFVADTNFRLYVGIKDSGAFQHSSFLQGGRISAAGLIKIKNGRLTSLSPLSGHYRPPATNFRAFVKSLKEAGVDMSRVSISKSYVVLVGLESYVKTRKKGKAALARLTRRKEKLLAPEQAQRREEAERDKSQSAEKERRYLESEQGKREEEAREENKAGLKMMEMLHISPRVPMGQRGGGDHEEQRATVNASGA